MRVRNSTRARAAALGFAAGLRTATPPAALHIRSRPVPSHLGRLLVASAAAEMAVEKLPGTPSRLTPFPLAGRLASGGVVGYAIAGRATVAIGAAAALAGAFSGHHARRGLTVVVRWPDLPGALIEDIVAVTIAIVAAR